MKKWKIIGEKKYVDRVTGMVYFAYDFGKLAQRYKDSDEKGYSDSDVKAIKLLCAKLMLSNLEELKSIDRTAYRTLEIVNSDLINEIQELIKECKMESSAE